MSHGRALVLNADYMPLGLVGWKRAVHLASENQNNTSKGVQVVDFYKDDSILTAGGLKLPVPAVVRLVQYKRQHRKRIPFSRKNVFIRDQLTCQYCGVTFEDTSKLTYDHVVPRAYWKRKKFKGTPTNWTNIVTCCYPCNNKKADNTPKEAGMNLLREPKEPSPHSYILGLSPWMRVPEEWVLYLTPIYKNILKDRNGKKV